MVDQLPDPPRERILVRVSFVAVLAGDEVKLLVLVLVLSFGQEDLESLDQQNKQSLDISYTGVKSQDNQLLQRLSPFSINLSL